MVQIHLPGPVSIQAQKRLPRFRNPELWEPFLFLAVAVLEINFGRQSYLLSARL